MRSISQASKDLLATGACGLRALILFKMDDGNYGIWDDVEPISFDTNTYKPSAGAFNIVEIQSGNAMSIQSVIVEFSDIDDVTLNLVDNYAWYRREVIIHLALFDTSSGTITEFIHYFTGILENIEEEESGDATSKLILNISSTNWEINDISLRVRTDIDQREIDPTDTFFSYVSSTVTEQPNWGKDGINHPTLTITK